MPTHRIKLPDGAKAGEVVEVRCEIQHPMETGFNVTSQGVVIPVEIITDFVCTYDGQEVFSVKLQPGLAANPYFSFFLKATTTGPVHFHWLDQNGTVTDDQAMLTVS